jgi:hypothetical protein
MPEEFEGSLVMVERQPDNGGPTVTPLRALDYEPPPRPRRRDPSVWLGIASAFFVSLGTGFAVFGLMMAANRIHDEIAAATGFGFGSFVFGLMLGGLYWLRRGREA